MLTDALTLLGSLTLLLLGGQMLVSGATGIALSLGIPRVIVGMTAVAFGTSAPEFSVSLFGALQGNPDITFGNIVGSNISNIGLILGLIALIRPLEVESQIITREIPMMLLACGALTTLALDRWHSGLPDTISGGDGIMLLLLFSVFLYSTIWEVRKKRKLKDAFAEDAQKEVFWKTFQKFGVASLLLLAGIFALTFGGKYLVLFAVKIAGDLGVPQVVIGATVLAIGTSLPELVTCLYAASKGMTDLVIGNIIGSNIFNTLLVLGATASIHPVATPVSGAIDLFAMALLSSLLLVVSVTEKKIITRMEGALLFGGYVWYFGWLMGR